MRIPVAMSKAERDNAFSHAMHIAMELTTCANPKGGEAYFKLCEELCDPQLTFSFHEGENEFNC
jgi:hypothetical protein